MPGKSDTKRGAPLKSAHEMIDHDPSAARQAPPPAASSDENRLRQRAIGVRLRQMFDEVVNEPVPDEFLDILRKADKGGE